MPNYCRTPEEEKAAADACALINTLLHPCHTAVSKTSRNQLANKPVSEVSFQKNDGVMKMKLNF